MSACRTCPFRSSLHAVAIGREAAEAIADSLDDALFRFVCHSDGRRTCRGSEVFRAGVPKRGYLVTTAALKAAQRGPRGPRFNLWGYPADLAGDLEKP